MLKDEVDGLFLCIYDGEDAADWQKDDLFMEGELTS